MAPRHQRLHLLRLLLLWMRLLLLLLQLSVRSRLSVRVLLRLYWHRVWVVLEHGWRRVQTIGTRGPRDWHKCRFELKHMLDRLMLLLWLLLHVLRLLRLLRLELWLLLRLRRRRQRQRWLLVRADGQPTQRRNGP